MSNVISVRGLKKSYGSTQAVAGIDLSIAQGEIFALLGPNGAGKTTTVEILEGFRTRDSGDVSVLNTDPAIKGEAGRIWRNRIGIVLQSTSDAGDLSVKETVAHFAKYYANPRDIADPNARRAGNAPLGMRSFEYRTSTFRGVASMALLASRFSHLKAYLASDSCGPDSLNFEQLLGFLYAVSSAPDIVDASEWLQFVFCERVSECT